LKICANIAPSLRIKHEGLKVFHKVHKGFFNSPVGHSRQPNGIIEDMGVKVSPPFEGGVAAVQ
jgi:hypothetical protein